MRTLIKLMLREELRTHTTYSGRRRFFSFPVMIFIFSFILAIFLKRILEEVSIYDLGLLAQASAFIYGIGVGSFGFLGKQYIERKYGTKNYLVTMPALFPITYRQTFLGIYIRDSIFYIALVLLPGAAALMAASAFAGFHIASILLFLVAAILSFQLGTALSFFASVLFFRSLAAFVIFVSGIASLVVAGGLFSLFDVNLVVPSIAFQLSVPPFGSDTSTALSMASFSLFLIFILLVLSIWLIRFHIVTRSAKFTSILPRYIERFDIAGRRKEIVGKEFVDLKRSGTIGKMILSFIFPLFFLSFTSWFVNTGLGIEVGFNTVFYAAMVGFIGVLMYSWLNNVDISDYYSILPITVPQIIKARLLVFFILTAGISTAFVITISVINSELDILWLALLVMIVTSIYMVVMTAYLTGIRTNTFLFDMSVLGKFAVLSFLPDVGLTILSFGIRSDWLFAMLSISLVLAILIGATIMLYRGIDRKWGRSSFDD